MPVSLVVRESCEIQSDRVLDATVVPRVACVHGQPFRVERGDVDPTAGAAPARAATVAALQSATTFLARSQRTLWMVTF